MDEYLKKRSTRDMLRRKLKEVVSEGTQVCDNLLDYISLLCLNKMTKNPEPDAKKLFQEDLNAFFGTSNSESFTKWIWDHLRKYRPQDDESTPSSREGEKGSSRRDSRRRRSRDRRRRTRSRSRSGHREREHDRDRKRERRDGERRKRSRSRSYDRRKDSSTIDQLKKRRKREDKSRRRERSSSKKKSVLETGTPLKKLFASLLKQTVKSRVEKAVASNKLKEENLVKTILQIGYDGKKLTPSSGIAKPPAEPDEKSSLSEKPVVERRAEKPKSKRKVMLENSNETIISVSVPEMVDKLGKSNGDKILSTNHSSNEKRVNNPTEQKQEVISEEMTAKKKIDREKESISEKTSDISSEKVVVDPQFLISFLGECRKKVIPPKHKRRFILDDDDSIKKEDQNTVVLKKPPTRATHKTAAALESVLNGGSTAVALESVLEPLILKYSSRIFGRGYSSYRGRRYGFRGYSWRGYRGYRGFRSRGYRGRGSRSRGRFRGYRGRGSTFSNLSWSAEKSGMISSEGTVPVPCYYDPICNRVDCHFQHPQRNMQTKEFLEKTGEQ